MDGKGYIYLKNQAFSTMNLPHSTITQTLCNFSPLLMFELGSIRRCLASLERSIGEFSMVYQKWVFWCGLGFSLQLVQLHKVYLEYSRYAFVSHTSCDKKSAKKWYLMRMCISWLCPFKICAGLVNNLSHFVKNQEYRTDRLNRATGFNLCVTFLSWLIITT